jgi:hypothetical protein
MTHKEIEQAAKALVEWFKSQEIGPRDALSIVAILLATIVGALANNEKDMSKCLDEIFPIIRRMTKKANNYYD